MSIGPTKQILLALICVWATLTVKGQVRNSSIESKFLKDSLLTTEGKVLFNSFSLKNNSAKAIELKVTLTPPCFTTLISAKEQQLIIEPGKVGVIPIRFTGNSNVTCDLNWAPFQISFVNATENKREETSFLLKQEVSYKWKAQLMQPSSIVTEKNRESNFILRLENSGNVEDTYTLVYNTHFPFDLSKNKTSITLLPGEIKMQEISFSLLPTDMDRLASEEITLIIANGKGDKKMLIQTVSKIQNLYIQNKSSYQMLPLNVELSVNKQASGKPYAYTHILGSVPMGQHRTLQIDYQSPSLLFNGNRFSPGLQVLEYRTPKWSIFGGTIYDNTVFNIFGSGIRFRTEDTAKSALDLMYVKNTYMDAEQAGAVITHHFNKKLSYSAKNFGEVNHQLKTKSAASLHELSLDMNNGFRMSVEGGIGSEIYKAAIDTSLISFSTSLQAEKTTGKLQGNISFSRSSKNFPGILKGFTNVYANLYSSEGNFTYGAYINLNKQAPSLYANSALTEYFRYANSEISARLGINGKKTNITFLPGYYLIRQDSLTSIQLAMPKLTTYINVNISSKLYGSLTNNFGYINVPEQKNTPAIFSMYNTLSLQMGRFGLFGRYDVGPYQYYELKEYLQLPTTFSRIQLSPFYTFNFSKMHFNVRTQLNATRAKPIKENFIYLSNAFTWQLPSSQLTASLLTNTNLADLKNNSINFSVRKPINLPLYKRKGFTSFKVVLFKDNNQDNQRNENEEVISGAPIILDKTYLQTNEHGEVMVKNASSQIIDIDLSHVNNAVNWVPAFGFKQQLPLTGSTIYVPFKKAKQIVGRLIVEKDPKSDLSFEMVGIRITAKGKSGAIFQTLSGVDGTFYLSAVEDEYEVSINQNVFDENFRVIDPIKAVDLINNTVVEANYKIVQKKREIKIKKE